MSSKQIKENRLKLESILKVIILCGHQNIPLRGHRDDSRSVSTNKGNFLTLIDFRCEAGDTILKEHLKSSSSRATYISKTIQNDLIKASGEYIRHMILKEVRSCKFFSVIADEATDSSNVTGFAKTLQLHTFNFATLAIHNLKTRAGINLKF